MAATHRASDREILNKYAAKIESTLALAPRSGESREYVQFRREMIPEITRYERFARSLGSLISIRVSAKDRDTIAAQLAEAHVNVTPVQALTLSIVTLCLLLFITLALSLASYLITGELHLLLPLLGIITSLFMFYYAYSAPQRLAHRWRLQASAQMVPAILYLVVYMKHTSNFERAMEFAAQHLQGPLALDFKKILYDVETARYPTLKQSLDSYLLNWREHAPEFVEAMHLIQASLYEPSDTRRIAVLEKALHVTLDGVYEKMLRYSREIRSPLTNIYMLGVILPTLGLALLPLASALLPGIIRWYHLLILFNIIVPFFVWYLASSVLLKRPGGYGETTLIELNPAYASFTSAKPWRAALALPLLLLLIALTPFLFQSALFTSLLGLENDYQFGDFGFPILKETPLFGFLCANGAQTCGVSERVGPFGPLGLLLSLCIPLAFMLYLSRVYRMKTAALIEARNNTKALEEEFANSLFQLGNRLGDGIPAEIAFAHVAELTKGQQTAGFFAIANQNIQQLGMPLETALFDRKRGALTFYPSPLIATSMRILIEAVKKGLNVAAASLMAISDYVKNIQKINQRLHDLLAEIVSDMKSNMTFLAPVLAGIVIGLSAMITAILIRLQTLQALTQSSTGAAANLGILSTVAELFNVAQMVPPYFLQLIAGIYLIEMIANLTFALTTINTGRDPLKEKYDLASHLRIGIVTYLATALLSIIALTLLVSIALSGIAA